MSNNVNVSLDTTVDPPALKVHDHGHIKVAKKSTPQTIRWNLTGTIAAYVVEKAIRRAVCQAESLYGVPACGS